MAPSNDTDILVLKSGKNIKRFSLNDIAYIQCDHPVCDIHFVDGKEFACAKSLRYFEDNLPSGQFIRINHKVLVNMNEVDSAVFLGGHRHDIILKGGAELSVSFRKWKTVKEHLI